MPGERLRDGLHVVCGKSGPERADSSLGGGCLGRRRVPDAGGGLGNLPPLSEKAPLFANWDMLRTAEVGGTETRTGTPKSSLVGVASTAQDVGDMTIRGTRLPG